MPKNKPAKTHGEVLPETKPVQIFSDLPEKATINFGFDAYAKTLAELIANRDNKTPLVIGVYGPWGSGKTTLMGAVKQLLRGKTFAGKAGFRPCKTVWFQAWKYEREDEILAGLIEEILKTIKKDSSIIERLKGFVEETIDQTTLLKGIGKHLEGFLNMDVASFFADLPHRDRLGFYNTFQEFFTRLVWTYTRLRPQFESSEPPDDTKGALVVFVDDLDRCPQSRIVKVLEGIKLFMDHPGCVFVIGADEEIIKKALRAEKAYEPGDAGKFMEKIVQVTFNLPHLSELDFGEFLEKLDDTAIKQLGPHLKTLVRTTHRNPRRFKHFINDLYLLAGIHRNKNTGIDFDNLLRWKIILFEMPGIWKETADSVWLLKTRVKEYAVRDDGSTEWAIPAEKIKEIRETHFRAYLENRKITNLLAQLTLNEPQIHQLVTLSENIKITGGEPGAEKQIIQERMIGARKSDLNTMVTVPAGKFLFGEGRKQKTVNIEASFEIDVYPVTNDQFARFIKDGGYDYKNSHWSEAGRIFMENEKITQPHYWDDEKWNQPDHPVVGVSWHEAAAYAKWAGKRLPTEDEWERAARGVDGQKYPWEGIFAEEKCNTRESGIGKTTPVTRYPNGISPVGCYDMAGNVWEWTSSFYDKDKSSYSLRGGSWYDYHEVARCAARVIDLTRSRYYFLGFRCVRTLT